MSLKFGSFVALAVVTLLVATNANAANAKTGQRFGDWGVKCETIPDKSQVCYVQQVLSEKGSKQPLMITVLGYGKGKPFPTAIFELPKGVDMKQGVQLKVDKNQAVAFQGKCDQQGCRAGFTLDNAMMQQIAKGQRALLAYRPGPNKEPVILPISLKGLAPGLKAVK
ncbi:invasion associated locus B family protein [uncultured Thiothrix sp.]|jgi:invasion protein IalB|uniref:invasion associated locus B family protein n=1 Tax=uncultured Thiothrix sp. TaxID=223185 RepID=UPI002609A039|nr:invasion associated locus B family protein [uncultured Thiothrix sp.]HMT92427.1 invasion associated locus B family protein [Thiolinea sp.]